MAKQQRQPAPEAKAEGAEQQQSEPAASDAVVSAGDAPEAKAEGADAASSSEQEPEREPEREQTEEHELTCPSCIALNGERPCSVACFVAAGYPAEQCAQMFGDIPQLPPIAEPQEAVEPKFVVPEGKAHCRAISTCLVHGMPAFNGAEFWLEPEQAQRLEGFGHLEILNKK